MPSILHASNAMLGVRDIASDAEPHRRRERQRARRPRGDVEAALALEPGEDNRQLVGREVRRRLDVRALEPRDRNR